MLPALGLPLAGCDWMDGPSLQAGQASHTAGAGKYMVLKLRRRATKNATEKKRQSKRYRQPVVLDPHKG